jgi:type IX secretion system substrate protein/von Willebrand factor type A domain-containing protein
MKSSNIKANSVAIYIAGMTLLAILSAQAQPALHLKRVVNNWPTIELYFNVACLGNPQYDMQVENFSITENSMPISTFTLWCPDMNIRRPMSIAMVFDVGINMAGDQNKNAIEAGNAFVDLMDNQDDDATVIWFSDDVFAQIGPTTNHSNLHTAIDALYSANDAPLWDGIYFGVEELVRSAVNPTEAVIVFSDGIDNGSVRNLNEIIDYANSNRIRVFTISLGSTESTELETLALHTGGKYYRCPTPKQVKVVYQEISFIIRHSFLECLITYESSCMDGNERVIDLIIKNYCNGTNTKTRLFVPPIAQVIIMRSGDELRSSREGAEYQWFLNGVEIPGATQRSYTALVDGVYTVRVTDEYGCAILSVESMVVTGINDPHTLAHKFDITPNPNSGEFHVDLEFNQPTTFSIRIVDISGKTVYEEAVESQTISFRKQLSVQALSPGVYFMVVQSGERFDRKKFVVQKN